MNFDSFFRPNIRALTPYRSARDEAREGILLDANENSFGSVLNDEGTALHRYPDPQQRELRTRIAELEGVGADNIFVGVGSDEVIDLLIRVACEPEKDRILLLEPTYGMYRVAAGINNVSCDRALLDQEFQIDVADVHRALRHSTKMVFCCSPNNPTGNVLSGPDIARMCDLVPGLVVVDEAYVDFSGGTSLGRSVTTRRNLVVLKTLSKSWGLAGVRLGYCVADPDVVRILFKVKPPYNINALTSMAAIRALGMKDRRDRLVASVLAERTRLREYLEQSPLVMRVFPSDANFLLVRFISSASVYAFLRSRGIVVRDRSSEPGLGNCLRITVGTPEQNLAVRDALVQYVSENSFKESS